ncbi:MAG: ABC transporter permease [Thermoplasmata archaeon]|nr:ABC transporter permease [Thermoplasmata archaeon]
MKLRRVLAFTKRALFQFRHDKRTFAFILAVPLLMILIFGYTFSGEVHNLTVIFMSEDSGLNNTTFPFFPQKEINLSAGILKNLDRDVLNINVENVFEKAKSRVENREAWAFIYIPENFTRDFVAALIGSGNGSKLTVYLDGSNPTITGAVFSALSEAVKKSIEEIASQNVTQNFLSVERNYIYGSEDTKFIDYFAPGVMSFAVMMVTTILTIILFVNERRNGTLQRIAATPARAEELVLGYALAFGIICLLQSCVIMLTGVLLFGITIQGNVVLAFAVFFIIGIGHQGLGILLSAGAKNELQAIQFIPFIIFPSVLLSGIFWPVESIPSVLQPLAYLVPLKYGIDAERSIMVRGLGFGDVWIEICILLAFAAITIAGSTILLRRKE